MKLRLLLLPLLLVSGLGLSACGSVGGTNTYLMPRITSDEASDPESLAPLGCKISGNEMTVWGKYSNGNLPNIDNRLGSGILLSALTGPPPDGWHPKSFRLTNSEAKELKGLLVSAPIDEASPSNKWGDRSWRVTQYFQTVNGAQIYPGFCFVVMKQLWVGSGGPANPTGLNGPTTDAETIAYAATHTQQGLLNATFPIDIYVQQSEVDPNWWEVYWGGTLNTGTNQLQNYSYTWVDYWGGTPTVVPPGVIGNPEIMTASDTSYCPASFPDLCNGAWGDPVTVVEYR